ncbi:MAG: HPr(Ser) kinase/phosphatase [Rhodanobacteraceae bacterium]|nr:HPr(Ser) kinase/phosphatase [Rhodanobacteraceae bacterium]MBL0041232.1 HPr(Ser) kinase/phosphatase [Xanthomonadales bacterium]MBP6077985.1 HPr(Ser) kinase/phosphatase [Xanthomonadales bacterium]MBP7623468.1 HPr(Ser) kinase/phosphatase [Xanthomonadales bacterium]
MIRTITARELFDQVADRMKLRWSAGQRGEHRLVEPGENLQRRPSLVGYLNIIYPNKVQIVGIDELKYLDALDSRQRWDTVQKIMNYKPTAIVVTRDQAVPADLREAAEETQTPIWVSAKRGHEVLTYMQYHLSRALARNTSLHGVFMEVYSIGVLITGDAGSGKSELALELVTRGHRLIADDAPEFTLIAPDVIDGTCPEMLQDLLEVRGLGILNVRQMFGDTSIKRNKYLRLVVHLGKLEDVHAQNDGMARLQGVTTTRNVLDVEVPQITLPVAAGRNLAVLVEAATRTFLLKSKGIDPAQTFIDRQAHQMRRLSPW